MREVNSKGLLLEIEKQWADPVKRDALPVPNPYARTNIVYSSGLQAWQAGEPYIPAGPPFVCRKVRHPKPRNGASAGAWRSFSGTC